jgi:GNAT superfamily N-acetyltransferase
LTDHPISSASEPVVERVTRRAHWRDFYRVRRTVYRNDPAAVVPLRSMEALQLDVHRHPFYLHASREAFVCYRDGEPVGRIAAIKDDLHNEYYRDRLGFFGFFECTNDQHVANALIDAASTWLADRGCTSLRGPVNPSMKSDFGVLVEGHSIPPYVMMGHSPLYYDQLLRQAGCSVAKRFFAFRFQTDEDSDEGDAKWRKIDRTIANIKKRYPKLKFRSVDQSNYEATLRDINELGNQVRRLNYGFVPLTDAELDFMIAQMRRIIRFDMIHAAYWDDQLVGFIVNIPDLNWALRKSRGKWDWLRMIQLAYWIKKTPRTRVIAIGVHEDFRKKGIAIVLIKSLYDCKDEFEQWEFSWVVEDNVQSIGVIGATMPLIRHKTYQLYEKPI